MAQYYQNTLAEKLRPEKLSVGWPWRLFTFSFLVTLAAVVIYFGLSFGYKNLLESRITKLDAEIEQLSQSVSQDQQEKLIRFYSQLANLQTLLNKHIIASNVFPIWERNTNQGVYYNVSEWKMSDRRMVLEGVAVSYQVFAQQLEAFNRMPEVERVVVNESYLGDGRVVFRLFLIFTDKIFSR